MGVGVEDVGGGGVGVGGWGWRHSRALRKERAGQNRVAGNRPGARPASCTPRGAFATLQLHSVAHSQSALCRGGGTSRAACLQCCIKLWRQAILIHAPQASRRQPSLQLWQLPPIGPLLQSHLHPNRCMVHRAPSDGDGGSNRVMEVWMH